MKCKIEYVGKWDEEEVYYCLTHHKKASINGEELDECLCENKEEFEHALVINKNEIKSIVFIYPNLLESTNNELIINDEKSSGILQIGNSLIEKRDFGGILLSKLNCIQLKIEKCPFCGNIHSDDGRFAYKPHDEHLCAYCGRLFLVEEPSIGNELVTIFGIPDIKLENKCLEIKNKLELKYDVLNGIVLINDVSCNEIKINNQKYNIADYLNEKLFNEF